MGKTQPLEQNRHCATVQLPNLIKCCVIAKTNSLRVLLDRKILGEMLYVSLLNRTIGNKLSSECFTRKLSAPKVFIVGEEPSFKTNI